MPDALSKTVPIWCTVINRAIALRRRVSEKDTSEWDEELYLPPQIVSASERAQIEARIDGWAKELEVSVVPSELTPGISLTLARSTSTTATILSPSWNDSPSVDS